MDPTSKARRNTVKVRELIEILKEFDPELPIFPCDQDIMRDEFFYFPDPQPGTISINKIPWDADEFTTDKVEAIIL